MQQSEDPRAQINADIDAYLASKNKSGITADQRLTALIQNEPAKAIRQLALHEMMLDRAEKLGTRKTLTNSQEFDKVFNERQANKTAYVETLNSVLSEILAEKKHQDVKKAATASTVEGLNPNENKRRFADTAMNLLKEKGIDVKNIVKDKLAVTPKVAASPKL